MQTSNSPPGGMPQTAQEARFCELCAWCANGVTAWKNQQGEYVHFKDGRQPCLAGERRKLAEPRPSVLEQMREAWLAETCVICGGRKRERKDFFCLLCWKRLPKDIQVALLTWLNRTGKAPPVAKWIEGVNVLRSLTTEDTEEHGGEPDLTAKDAEDAEENQGEGLTTEDTEEHGGEPDLTAKGAEDAEENQGEGLTTEDTEEHGGK